MEYLNKKSDSENTDRISFLAAYALFLTYAEALLPRFTPFFRLGLGNTVILLAFEFTVPSFLLLIFIKTVVACMINGTLVSPFFLISICQSLASGLFMYLLNKIKGKWISVYGLSLAGSALSAVVQILLCSLYLKTGVFVLLGPMLLFSIFSGFVTALLSEKLSISQNIPDFNQLTEEILDSQTKQSSTHKIILVVVSILIFSTVIFTLKNIYVLAVCMTISFTAQVMCHRKIRLMPHISMWLFVILSCLLIPQGEVLCKFWNFSITKGALLSGIEKAMKLSAVMALSQCLTVLRPKGTSILSRTLIYLDWIKKNNSITSFLPYKYRKAEKSE